MNHHQKKLFSGVLVAFVVGTVGVAVFYKDRLLRGMVSALAENERSEFEHRLGESLPDSLMVLRGDGPKPISLASLFDKNGAIMLWSPSCPPCASAVDSYIVHASGMAEAPRMYVLSIDPAAKAPPGLSKEHFLRPVTPLEGSLLEVRSTPTFLKFDSERRLRWSQVGFDRAGFLQMLDSLVVDDSVALVPTTTTQ